MGGEEKMKGNRARGVAKGRKREDGDWRKVRGGGCPAVVRGGDSVGGVLEHQKRGHKNWANVMGGMRYQHWTSFSTAVGFMNIYLLFYTCPSPRTWPCFYSLPRPTARFFLRYMCKKYFIASVHESALMFRQAVRNDTVGNVFQFQTFNDKSRKIFDLAEHSTTES
jgi:hypothetical protein